MEYLEFLNIVNERINQGRIFTKLVYMPVATKIQWRNYIMFLQPTKVKPNDCHRFAPMFSVLLDGNGRLSSDERMKGGLGISGIEHIDDLTVEDYTDFARCLKNMGLKFNRKLNTIVGKDEVGKE